MYNTSIYVKSDGNHYIVPVIICDRYSIRCIVLKTIHFNANQDNLY